LSKFAIWLAWNALRPEGIDNFVAVIALVQSLAMDDA